MFQGLSSDCTSILLLSCEFRGIRSHESASRFGAHNDEMYILLSGQHGVYDQGQISLTSIQPEAPVGEMGLMTGRPSSAMVGALRRNNLPLLRKVALERLMRSNDKLCVRVCGSVLKALAQRLGASRIETQLAMQRQAVLEWKLAEVEAQVAALSPREAV